MYYRNLGKYKRAMNFIEKILVGWRHMEDNRFEWWYHLTETPEELNHEFWRYLNMDMVKYEEELYYNGN